MEDLKKKVRHYKSNDIKLDGLEKRLSCKEQKEL